MNSRSTNIYSAGTRCTSAPALREWVPAGRRLVLVDVENLVGGSLATASRVADALDRLGRAVGRSADDVWVTACGPTLLNTAMGKFTGRVLLGRGEDGADQRLLEHLEPAVVVGRYSSVVLASGDSAAFAAPVRELATHGVPTDVYVGRGFVGADLYRAARSVITNGTSQAQQAA